MLATRLRPTPAAATTLRTLSIRYSSTSSRSPAHPSLFYHPLEAHPTYSHTLSFLPTPPPSLNFSPTTLGFLLSTSFSASGGGAALPDVTPRNFVEHDQWRPLLHEVLRECVRDDLTLDTMAKSRGEDGYIHIADARNPCDTNRIPDPSDIIASLLVQGGKVVPESYEPSPTHRVVSMDGVMQLEEGLMKTFVKMLERVREVEVEAAKEEGDEERRASQTEDQQAV